jgi:hypothetical protein
MKKEGQDRGGPCLGIYASEIQAAVAPFDMITQIEAAA